ncbi:MAG: hypothetical protein CMQ29_11710 [Gammaproteobacteria bacterium]|nr:hypothetical protein [Gammaproteobacteria bacterium]
MSVSISRFSTNPLLEVGGGVGLEENVNGPSVIRVPEWVNNPLGRYYLYFAHHEGETIRLAWANAVEGPYRVYEPGALHLQDSFFPISRPGGVPDFFYAHIASPDVHIIDDLHEIRMYFHGWHSDGRQLTRVATSRDGIRFDVREELLGPSYFRVFRRPDAWYALAMPGLLLRSEDGLSNFEPGPTLFNKDMRHSAVLQRGDTLHVFYTKAHDAPESILHATIVMTGDWRHWQENASELVASPEQPWEGVDEPVLASKRGAILERVHQLRDPAVFEDQGVLYLFYSGGGEFALGGARLML